MVLFSYCRMLHTSKQWTKRSADQIKRKRNESGYCMFVAWHTIAQLARGQRNEMNIQRRRRHEQKKNERKSLNFHDYTLFDFAYTALCTPCAGRRLFSIISLNIYIDVPLVDIFGSAKASSHRRYVYVCSHLSGLHVLAYATNTTNCFDKKIICLH